MKPFLKWVGGKTQIIEEVLSKFPTTTINGYYEPFVGGGSVLLAVLSYKQQGKLTIHGPITASDLNGNLIALYKAVQTNLEGLIRELKQLQTEFASCKEELRNRNPTTLEEALKNRESYYYWIRAKFNTEPKETLQSSAKFLFLNKTCFRGVYREGPYGFNVPYGNYTNPSIVEEAHLRAISALLQGVVFRHCSFTDVLGTQTKGDFVYLDPPYAPESATSFVSYTKNGFKLDDHKALFKQCATLHTNGATFLLSNADVKLVKDSFPEPIYTTKSIVCRRAIHSKSPDSKTKEVLITNLSTHPAL